METARTPAAVTWPEKLITQAEAFVLAADWPVYAGIGAPEQMANLADPDLNLYCGKCQRSTGQLRRAGVVYNGSLDEQLSMVLRHMVMAHDVSLAGLRAKTEVDEHGR